MKSFKKFITVNVIKSLIILAIAAVLLIGYIFYIDIIPEGKYKNLINILTPALLLGFIITALSKVGLIMSVQDISEEAQKSLGELGDLISGSTTHGLSGAIDSFSSIEEMNGLEMGDTVRWIDTRISASNIVTDLTKVLEKGIKIRLIVMHPDSDMAKYRYLDIQSATDYEDYKNSLVTQKKELDFLLSKKEFDLEVLYTCESISLPIFLVNSGNHEYAYTGHFLHDRAIEFPYVYWKSGRKGFIDELERYFKRKWKRTAEGKDVDVLISEKEASRVSD